MIFKINIEDDLDGDFILPEIVYANDDTLKDLILDGIKRYGIRVNLNYIDVFSVTDMRYLFSKNYYKNSILYKDDKYDILKEFDGDISLWDVSNVTKMKCMFSESKFNGDISKWNVSNVIDMTFMFEYSIFNGDISSWNVSKVTNMGYMFSYSIFNGDISKWDTSSVTVMFGMFNRSKFNGDISKWDVSNVKSMNSMFSYSLFDSDISLWEIKEECDIYNIFKNCPIRKEYKPIKI